MSHGGIGFKDNAMKSNRFVARSLHCFETKSRRRVLLLRNRSIKKREHMRKTIKSMLRALMLSNAVVLQMGVGSVASGEEPKTPGIIAQNGFHQNGGSSARIFISPLRVVRSPEEMVSVSTIGLGAANREKAASDPVIQKAVTEQVTKLLKVEKIDWKNQMLIVMGDSQARRGVPKRSYSLKVAGGKLTVQVAKDQDGFAGCGTEWAILIVDRFDGQIEFESISKDLSK